MEVRDDKPAIEEKDRERVPEGPIFTRALSAAIGRTPIWFFIWAITALASLCVSYSHFGWFRGALQHRYAPGSMTYTLGALPQGRLDPGFRLDHGSDLALLSEATAQLGAVLAFLMILFGVFSAGGWLQIILERTQGHSMRRFFFGGSRYFWRFFRLAILSLVVLSCCGWVVYEWPWKHFVLDGWLGLPEFDLDQLETLESEWTVWLLRGGQDLFFALLFGLTLTWGDYARTRLALHDTGSAVGAGLRTFFTLLRHPIKTLRPMVLLLALEAVVLYGASWFAGWIEGGLRDDASYWRLLSLLLIGMVVMMWRVVTRGARYHAAVAVSADVVRPLSRPDPWKQSIGGPGGPRYPLEDEGDEYGVAL